MASRFSLSADITPTVDSGAAEQEADDLAGTFEQRLGDLQVGVDGGGIGGLGGARGGGGGLGGVAGTAGASGAAGLLSGAGSGAAGALSTVALGGVVGFGILQGVQALSSASPALKQTASMFGEAMSLFFRPFGQFLSGVLRPFATAGLNMAIKFNEIAEQEGLGVAMMTVSSSAAKQLATGYADALGDLASGEGTLSDLLFAGVGTIALTELVTGVSVTALLRSAAVSSVFRAASIATLLRGASITSLLTGTSIGSLLSGVSAGSLIAGVGAATILGTVSAAAIIGTVGLTALVTPASISEVIEFQTSGGEEGPQFLGEGIDPSESPFRGPGSGIGGGDGGGGGGGSDTSPRDGGSDIDDDGIKDRLDRVARETRRTREALERLDESILENARDETLDPF